MAKDSSFDVVSELDLQEVDNAVNQATKEIANRYDLKKSDTTIELDRENSSIGVESENDYTLGASVDVLKSKLVKRGVSLKALDEGKVEPATSGRARQTIGLTQGIETEKGKEVVKALKDAKLKVSASIQGDSVRVSGKNKDDLQEAIAVIKGADFGQPLQFVNYR